MMARPSAGTTDARLTTLWGGSGVALSALLSLAIGLPFVTVNGVTALSWYDVPGVVTSVVSFIAALILASAISCLGFGVGGETGLVGDSRVGRFAVRVFVISSVASSLVHLVFTLWAPTDTIESAVGRSDVNVVLGALALASLLVAVIVVLRRGMMNHALRWGVVIVVAWMFLAQAIWYFPFLSSQPDVTVMTVLIFAGNGYFVGLLLQGVLGVSIALHRQAPALRRRAAFINEHW